MAQTIKLKRSATQNAVPSTSSLALGELAINTYDGKLFIKKNVSGTESIVTIGEVGAGSIGPTELASTAVTAGSYGSTSAIPVITIDADGRITSASTATISGLSANSVTSTEIAANAVGISELNVSDGTDGQVLTTDGNGNLAFEDQSGGAASATAFSTNIASGDGSTTAFTLSESPSAESKIIAFINGVFQNQDAYTISGTTLTFDTAPISGTNNVVVYVIGDVYSGESVLISNFSGNGTTTAFTLANNPGNENNTQVYIDGVYQQKTTYSVSGTTLTFSSAPPTGTNNIEVVMLTSTTVNTPAAGSVVTASMADDSVTASKIVSSAVTTAKIADSNVTTAKIADSNVTTAKIADSNVTTAKIADDAVTIGKIADAALVIESEGIGSNDNDTTLPTSAAVKDYVDTQVAGKDNTDEITEGSTNLYYTDARVGTYISGNRTYGNITTTGYLAGPSTFTIDPAAVGDNTGTLVIAGNLQVDGTTTTINSTTLTVDDKLVTLASGSANAGAANGAGIEVDISGATNPSILYDGTNDEWDFNKNVNVAGNITAQTGGLTVGTSDTTGGVITVHGNGTGNNEGGEIRLQTSADHDSTYEFYRLDVVEDDFRIGRAGTTDLTLDSSGNVTFAGTISSGAITATGASSFTDLAIGGAADSNYDLKVYGLARFQGTANFVSSGNVIQIGGTTVIDSSRNLTNIGTISSGAITSSASITASGNSNSFGNTTIAALSATSGTFSASITASGNSNSFGNSSFGTISSGRITTSDGIADTGQAGSATIFNESGSTADFRIESDSKPYMFFLDGGLNRIGINTGTPTHTLHILNEVSSDTIDESNGLVKMQSSGGNGMIFGTIASSPYTSYIQSAYVVDTSIAQYNLTLNPIGGNVGIGTTSPDAKLRVEGDGTWIRHAGYGQLLDLGNWTDGLVRIESTGAPMYIKAAGSNYMAFDTNSVERMRIDSSGNVGIGTGGASTSFKLDVRGNVRIGDASSSEQDIHFYNSNTEWQVGVNNGGNGTDSNQFYFYEGGNYRLTVHKGGNVGIGTTSPSTQLHVYGSNNSAGDLWTQVGAGNIPSITIQNAGTTDNNNAAIFFRNDSGMFAAINARFRNHTTDETELRFSTTNSSGTTRERMKLDGDGDIQVDGRLGYTAGRHRKAIYHFQDTSNASGSTYYVHFKTNISTSSNTMTRWEFEGYNYGDAKVVKADWAVHTSNGNLYARAYNSLNTGFQAANIYESSDSYVVIVGSYTVRYYLSGAVNVHDSPIYATQASSITAHTITTSNSGAY